METKVTFEKAVEYAKEAYWLDRKASGLLQEHLPRTCLSDGYILDGKCIVDGIICAVWNRNSYVTDNELYVNVYPQKPISTTLPLPVRLLRTSQEGDIPVIKTVNGKLKRVTTIRKRNNS